MKTKQPKHFATADQSRMALEYTGYIFAKMDGVVFSQQQEDYFSGLKKIIEKWPKNFCPVL